MSIQREEDHSAPTPGSNLITFDAKEFPWWLAGMVLIILAMLTLVATNDNYGEAFRKILPWPWRWTQGLALTLLLTAGSFIVAIVLGLFIGLGRLSRYEGHNTFRRLLSVATRNLSTLYIEFIRGVPMLVFIFTIALVLAPDFADLINVNSRSISQAWRGAAALSLFYAAFIAEVFRAGIQSVHSGQIEAGRALGLSGFQILRRITLPQAFRNMFPALANDLIALMKDTSLLSVLAVRELTQMARLYSGSSFRFRESFFILVVMYVILTLTLSLVLRRIEGRMAIPGR
ncbi:MAG: amino acid ABC transporter permease [Acidimicrobiia bacterium]|nr:amino acid ABC transporter permease [Acidimicrobiia bacterium]